MSLKEVALDRGNVTSLAETLPEGESRAFVLGKTEVVCAVGRQLFSGMIELGATKLLSVVSRISSTDRGLLPAMCLLSVIRKIQQIGALFFFIFSRPKNPKINQAPPSNPERGTAAAVLPSNAKAAVAERGVVVREKSGQAWDLPTANPQPYTEDRAVKEVKALFLRKEKHSLETADTPLKDKILMGLLCVTFVAAVVLMGAATAFPPLIIPGLIITCLLFGGLFFCPLYGTLSAQLEWNNGTPITAAKSGGVSDYTYHKATEEEWRNASNCEKMKIVLKQWNSGEFAYWGGSDLRYPGTDLNSKAIYATFVPRRASFRVPAGYLRIEGQVESFMEKLRKKVPSSSSSALKLTIDNMLYNKGAIFFAGPKKAVSQALQLAEQLAGSLDGREGGSFWIN